MFIVVISTVLIILQILLLILGGDPTSTGRGGTSIYGTHFDDEIHEDLRHTG